MVPEGKGLALIKAKQKAKALKDFPEVENMVRVFSLAEKKQVRVFWATVYRVPAGDTSDSVEDKDEP